MTIETLHQLAADIKNSNLAELAAVNEAPPLEAAGWKADLSRQYMSPAIEAALFEQAETIGLSNAVEDLFGAAIVNPSENRPALHWALRMAPESEITQSEHKTTVDALANQLANLDLRFCANVDPLDLDLALQGLDPAKTLIIGISKSFGTEETLYNLARARAWLEDTLGADKAAEHLLLVTANAARATDWLGGTPATTLDMPISVGGRYSIWSAASVAVMTSFGTDTFEAFLAGAADMDAHVKSTPMKTNLAARLALLDYWNTSFLGFGSRAVLAYSRRLRMLPTYLQQLEMESNGKSVGPDGRDAPLSTAPLLWGGEGSVGQHSYHQWLHQGTHVVPAEFILAPGSNSDAEGVEALTAHALAQAEVLSNGRSLTEVKSEEPDLPEHIAKQKVHPGGRPSTFLSTPELTPEKLGALIALYEHRTYLAGVLWEINSFDQWGVERGKTMATRLKPALRGQENANDPATRRIINQIK